MRLQMFKISKQLETINHEIRLIDHERSYLLRTNRNIYGLRFDFKCAKAYGPNQASRYYDLSMKKNQIARYGNNS